MFDEILADLVIALPTLLAIAFVFIPNRNENEKAYLRWRAGLLAFGIFFSLLIAWQQHRAIKSALSDREGAIQQTSERVATETSAKVTRAVSEQYGQTIINLNQKISELQAQARGQSDMARKELGLKLSPSVDLTYGNERLQVWNRGKTNILLWGDKYGDTRKDIGATPIAISPGTNYYLLTDTLRPLILSQIGQNGESRVPFELYIQAADKRKYVVHGLLWEIVKNGELTIHTQNHGIEQISW